MVRALKLIEVCSTELWPRSLQRITNSGITLQGGRSKWFCIPFYTLIILFIEGRVFKLATGYHVVQPNGIVKKLRASSAEER